MDDGRCEFFFNDAATTEIYTLALHDALPIFRLLCASQSRWSRAVRPGWAALLSSSAPTVRIGSASPAYARAAIRAVPRSEEHTSELQSRQYLVCPPLLEKKNNYTRSFSLPTS